MNNTNETIADIRQEADRLEAALKREKAAIEADALAVGGLVEASRSTAENSSAVGDAAKLREALVQCELFLGYVSRHGHPTLNPGDKCTACSDADELRGMVVRALAAPPRNCDVGTVEEQQERFAKYCRVHSDAHECGIGYAIGNPKAKCPAYKTIDCQLVWAQMPYEEGGAK